MADLGRDLKSSLVDLTEMSLGDLAGLDDALVDGALDRLLPACGGVGGRLWEAPGLIEGDGIDARVTPASRR